MKVRVDNIQIKNLLALLSELSNYYDVVDMIVDEETKTIILDPVEKSVKVSNVPPSVDIKFTDENIDDFI